MKTQLALETREGACAPYAVCPGSEGAALKAVGPKGLAGANPVGCVVGY